MGLRLYRAALAGDLVAMAAALAQGAEVNRSFSWEQGRTPLIAAAIGVRRNARLGSQRRPFDRASVCGLQGSLLACEFLLLNGANINHRDLRGQGALHAAATAGHTGYCTTITPSSHIRP